jgi:hypothetical protein
MPPPIVPPPRAIFLERLIFFIAASRRSEVISTLDNSTEAAPKEEVAPMENYLWIKIK